MNRITNEFKWHSESASKTSREKNESSYRWNRISHKLIIDAQLIGTMQFNSGEVLSSLYFACVWKSPLIEKEKANQLPRPRGIYWENKCIWRWYKDDIKSQEQEEGWDWGSWNPCPGGCQDWCCVSPMCWLCLSFLLYISFHHLAKNRAANL